jgi:hypothetical protein
MDRLADFTNILFDPKDSVALTLFASKSGKAGDLREALKCCKRYIHNYVIMCQFD